jgi:uroporphyrinogen decarboxylase
VATTTSRERVLSAFQFEEPEKVPCWCGASVEFWEKAKQALALDDEELRRRFGDDFRRLVAPYAETGELPAGITSRTPFGVNRVGFGYGQPVSHPLAKASISDLHEYPWPDPSRVDISKLRAEAEAWGGRYAILGGDWSPYWHDAIDLLGMETLYLKMYDEPALVDTLLDYIVGYYAESSRRIFDESADLMDIFFIGNDFGSQTGPLMGAELFDRFMLPHLQRFINLGHDYGLLVQLHCCGGFEPLIPSMIKSGLDGVHAIQPDCHGMELKTLKEQYGHKILFNGCIDSHHILINGDSPDFVREQTLQVLGIMAPGGGYVAGASHDVILEETPVENVLAMFDAVGEYGES